MGFRHTKGLSEKNEPKKEITTEEKINNQEVKQQHEEEFVEVSLPKFEKKAVKPKKKTSTKKKNTSASKTKKKTTEAKKKTTKSTKTKKKKTTVKKDS